MPVLNQFGGGFEFLDARTNHRVGFGQKYKSGTNIAGGSQISEGVCAGLTMAWLNRVRIRDDVMVLPDPVEGQILQYRYESMPSARNRDKILPTLRQIMGMQVALLFFGEDPSQFCDILQADSERIGKTQKIKMYLLLLHQDAGVGHAIGVAVVPDKLAFFDSNRGIYAYSFQAAFEQSAAIAQLMTFVRMYGGHRFNAHQVM